MAKDPRNVTTLTVTFKGKEFSDVEQGMQEVARHLERGFRKAAAPVSREMMVLLEKVADRMQRLHGNPWRSGGTGQRLFTRTGKGLESIRRSIKVSGRARIETLVGQIGAKAPIALHEKGRRGVRATRAKFMTIPLPAALSGRGTPLRRRARDWPNTFVAKSRAGNLIIFQRRGDEIVPLYLLKREVSFPPRLSMEDSIRKQLSPFANRLLNIIGRELDKL